MLRNLQHGYSSNIVFNSLFLAKKNGEKVFDKAIPL
jgi:hypothetical protein